MDLSFNSFTSVEARQKTPTLLKSAGLALIVGHVADSFDVTDLGIIGYFRPIGAI